MSKKSFQKQYIELPIKLERVAGIGPAPSAWKAEVLPLNYTRDPIYAGRRRPCARPRLIFITVQPNRNCAVEGGGFEPPKAEPSDLQSDPFGRSGTPPKRPTIVFTAPPLVNRRNSLFSRMGWSWREELNPRPTDYKSVALPTELRQQRGHYPNN